MFNMLGVPVILRHGTSCSGSSRRRSDLMVSHWHGSMGSGTELMRMVIIAISVILWNVEGGGAQGDPVEPPGGPNTSLAASFRPSIAVIIGVLATMFSLTFLLLLYAKHCKTAGGGGGGLGVGGGGGGAGAADASRASAMAGAALARRDSGVERSVIEALPIFKFGSLKGTKDGLECAVCLSRYEDSEFLRLLPKCKHAFHIDCVDTWLDAHSSCPLCRNRVEPQDLFFLDHAADDAGPQVFVQRDYIIPNPAEESSRFALDASFRRLAGIGSWRRDRSKNGSSTRDLAKDNNGSSNYNNNNNNSGSNAFGSGSGSRRQEGVNGEDHGVLLAEAAAADEEQFARRFAHRIIVSDVLFQRRWSDFKPSDLLFLSSQMILPGSGRLSFNSASQPPPPPPPRHGNCDYPYPQARSEVGLSKELDFRQGSGMNRSASVPAGRAENMSGKRSMSEIIGFHRFSQGNNNYLLPLGSRRDQASTIQTTTRDTKWLSIARTTLQWLAGREKKHDFHHTNRKPAF